VEPPIGAALPRRRYFDRRRRISVGGPYISWRLAGLSGRKPLKRNARSEAARPLHRPAQKPTNGSEGMS
jgi:hypothetical protein